MRETVERFLAHSGISAEPPAGERSLRVVESLLGVQLPAALRELWQKAGKTRLDPINADILGPDEVREVFSGDWPDEFQQASRAVV